MSDLTSLSEDSELGLDGYLDEEDILAELLITNNDESRFLLVVEGSSDLNLARDHYPFSHDDVIMAAGKPRVLAAAQEALSEFPLATFLVDSDFDIIRNGRGSFGANIAFTDHYDLYMDILMKDEPLLRRVLRRVSSELTPNLIERIVSESYEICRTLGTIRYLSSINSYGFNMINLPVHMFIDTSTSNGIDVEKFLSLMLSRATGECANIPSSNQLIECLNDFPSSLQVDRLINSHDLMSTLRFVIKLAEKEVESKKIVINYKLDDLVELAVNKEIFLDLRVSKFIISRCTNS